MRAPELMIVGRLRRAHGVRGDLIVEPITDAPADVYAAGRRLFIGTATGDIAPDEPPITVRTARPILSGALIVSFAEIRDRTRAEQLRNHYLLAPAHELAPPADGEVYIHELLGMQVTAGTGEPLGAVLDVYELPQGLVLEIDYRGESVLLPFREEFVASIDRAGRRIVATPPEGLFE